MPKMKTNRGAAKRFKVTGSGRLKRESANRSHILTKKAPKRLRQLRKAQMVGAVDEPRIKHMLGM
ncbi:MAG: 50S ribosomal protein L35 [Chlorobi bacterium]|nr:MAG: 50S ribosomal protein L35 [Chlorobi bacterium OLB7]MBK8910908.1 50S ribosomal protein L35 [Chlorobiota bacterium]MBX7218084.1 50S ribosomal protein L35 [Candidatus Kapabacteria bacterium]MCE7934657.1 50S ribosomal protein L35 [Chlorobi bacterium CHB2]